jgi:hypothetical protein
VIGVGRAALSANDRQEVTMKKVRLTVRLTNAGDEAMVRRGLLSADKVRHCEADAFIDTEAFRSVLPSHVVQRLGLAIVGRTSVTYANDVTEGVDITEAVGIDINGRRTTEETLVLGSEVLIGETVLASLDLQVDSVNHRVIPNPAHPEQSLINVKYLVRSEMPHAAVHS